MYILLQQKKQEKRHQNNEGYLQAFISVKHNYGNFTERGEEYKRTGRVSEQTWTTYNGTKYKKQLTLRRKGEWRIITKGLYSAYKNEATLDQEIDFTDGGKYSEETPFTDFLKEHGITNVKMPDIGD